MMRMRVSGWSTVCGLSMVRKNSNGMVFADDHLTHRQNGFQISWKGGSRQSGRRHGLMHPIQGELQAGQIVDSPEVEVGGGGGGLAKRVRVSKAPGANGTSRELAKRREERTSEWLPTGADERTMPVPVARCGGPGS